MSRARQLADSADLSFDGTTLVVDETNNRVGIGEASPSVPLEVYDASNSRILASTSNTGASQFCFGDDADDYVGRIYYDHNGNSMRFHASSSEAMRIDSQGVLNIGTDGNANINGKLNVTAGNFVKGALDYSGDGLTITSENATAGDNAYGSGISFGRNANDIYRKAGICLVQTSGDPDFNGLAFFGSNNSSSGADMFEAGRFNSGTGWLIGTTNNSPGESSTATGIRLGYSGRSQFSADSNSIVFFNRTSNDGTLVDFRQNGTSEGSISVSGTTVSYNGGHLSRWSRLADDSKDTSIVKGTVMTNLDEMVVWSHDAVEAQDAVYDEDGNLVSEAVEAKETYTEDNEQLNKMAVSSVEGDPNVAGVFVNWDEDDDEFNDMNVAMTGDMVIRIASGTTVARGDLLMSAGDGTAKPQGDDIVRSKTIAKVISTHVSHTYDDGSYLVPCVLMAC